MISPGDAGFLVLLLLNLVCCAFMCGLTTFVHLVHYPGFHFITPGSGNVFHHFHANRTAVVVAVPMLGELFLSVLIGIGTFGTAWFWWSIPANLLLLYVWLETALKVIPVHSKLSGQSGFQSALIDKLCKANRPRTVAWNLRLLCLILFIGCFIVQ